MLDAFTIFDKGGAVLWSRTENPEARRAIDPLVQNVLLQERKAESSFKFEHFVLKWLLENELDLVFVAVYLNLTQLLYIDDLLAEVRRSFCNLYRKDGMRGVPLNFQFDEKFDRILAKYESKVLEEKKQPRKPKTFAETAKGQKVLTKEKEKPKKKKKGKPAGSGGGKGNRVKRDNVEIRDVDDDDEEDQSQDEDDDGDDENTDEPDGDAEADAQDEEDAVAPLPSEKAQQPDALSDVGLGSDSPITSPTATSAAEQKAARNDATSDAGSLGHGSEADLSANDTGDDDGDDAQPDAAETAGAPTKSPSKNKLMQLAASRGKGVPRRGKATRGRGGKARGGFNIGSAATISSTPVKKPAKWKEEVSEEELAALDFSKKPSGDSKAPSKPMVGTGSAGTGTETKGGKWWEEESDDEEEKDPSTAKRGMFSFLTELVTGKVLRTEDLEPALEAMRQHLMTKNVAADISDQLCKSVCASLEGKNIGTFSTVRSMVKKTMEDALTQILTPKQSVDVMQGVAAARAQGRPYTVVFVGVNGVGKSTSLAKLCSYFLDQQLKVMIAACDTFRSGAVEQLRTHAQCLGVPLFERGYNKDASSVAMDAVKEAKKQNFDVVLVDTAGRMQDNEPLMRALSKLINLNKPDLVLFVGEALVGNDAVDQLTKFNKCLEDLATEAEPRLIDGIVLTKFDTIDDKVGAAISMTYSTGKPIMFVGCGQTYRDLKQMNVKLLIKALLK